jgi:hypothetical protein
MMILTLLRTALYSFFFWRRVAIGEREPDDFRFRRDARPYIRSDVRVSQGLFALQKRRNTSKAAPRHMRKIQWLPAPCSHL